MSAFDEGKADDASAFDDEGKSSDVFAEGKSADLPSSSLPAGAAAKSSSGAGAVPSSRRSVSSSRKSCFTLRRK